MLVSAKEGHRLWSASYDQDPNPLLALDLRVLSERLGPLRDLLVVDVACGTGRWMSVALAQGARVTGVDLCEEMLVAGAGKSGLKGRFAMAHADQLPVSDACADLVLCCFAMSYFPSAAGAIAEMARIARHSGRVVVADLHPGASEAGWKRTFRSGGALFELEHQHHSMGQLNSVAAQWGLQQAWQVDARLAEPEREIFRRAGKDAAFAAVSSIPALRTTCWNKL